MSHRECNGMSRMSRTSRAGLKFPVGRIHRFLRKGIYGKHFSANAPVFLAAVMMYLTKEILFLVGYEAWAWRCHHVIPHHLQLAMHQDVDLDELFKNVMTSQSGAVTRAPIQDIYQCVIQVLPPAGF